MENKHQSIKDSFGILLFLFVLLVAIFSIVPIYKSVNNFVRNYVEKLCDELEDKTGLTVSYGNISPSVLTGVRIKRILLKDSSDDDVLVVIKSATLKYSLKNLIKRDTSNAFLDLIIDGFELDLDKDADLYVLEKLSNLLNLSQDEKVISSKSEKSVSKSEQDLSEISFNLPINFYIKNVSLKYSVNSVQYGASIKKLILNYLDNNLQVNMTGGVNVVNNASNISCKFSANGNINQNLTGSSLIFRISDISNGKFTVSRMNLLFDYNENILGVKTVQNGYPLFIQGAFDLINKNISLSLKTHELTVSDLLSGSRNQKLLKKLRNLSATLGVSLNYDFASKDFSYNSEGNLVIPKELLNDDVELNYSLNGNARELFVNSLTFVGNNYDFSFVGNYVYKTMGLAGIGNLNKIVLPNGGIISSELYFDPLESGFMCFAPQLLLNEKAFTALQLMVVPRDDSVDFNFELSDYAHEDNEGPGQIKINGSYISNIKYLQANLSTENMYLDSIGQTASFFMSNSSKSSFGILSSYVLNGDLYLSSDLKSLSYNVPYAFIANTKKDNNLIYISLDGNNSSVQLSNLDVIFGGFVAKVSGQLEKSPDSDDAFFVLNVNTGSIPYNLTGSIMPGVISVSGDYGLSLDVHSSQNGRYDGVFSITSLPIYAAQTIFSFGIDAGFSYSGEEGVSVKIARAEVSESGSKFNFKPKLEMSASISKYGAIFDKIIYSDIFSTLNGSAQGLWNINNGIFDSASLEFNLQNKKSTEAASITASVSNVAKDENVSLLKSLYLNSQIVFNNFGLNRFVSEHSDNNSLTATVIASGSLENPYIGLNVDTVNLMFAGNVLSADCSAYVEDKIFKVDKLNVNYNNLKIEKVAADFSLDSFTGKASAFLSTTALKKTLKVPLEFSITNTVMKEGKLFPAEFVANLTSKNISGTLLKDEIPFNLTVLHNESKTSIFTSERFGLFGTISKNKDIKFSIKKGKPLFFNLTGNLNGLELNFDIDDIYINVAELYKSVVVDALKIYEGIAEGSLKIRGIRSDPEFLGALSLRNVDFSLPKVIPSHITVPKTSLIFNHNQIDMPFTVGKIKKNYPISAIVKIYMDRWSADRIEADIKTLDDIYAPAKLTMHLAEFEGDANIDLKLVLADGYFDVTGDVFVKNTDARVKTRELAMNTASPKMSFSIRSDLNIHLGSHVGFSFDPILRCIFVPNSSFSFKFDQETSSFEIDGDIELRSGDIAYLSRNFYLKNGSIRFNSNDPSFNPLITVRAETRERDEDGNEVRIILTAENQYLLNFSPQFSSIPAKSENEIRTLLGQIALGDSENMSSLLLATSDYALHSTFGRAIENKLRDLLNFDILSVRTMVLQNALKYGLSSNKSDNDLAIGNFLDNSTVYIGKYFGSELYVDALLHWSYDETKVDNKFTPGGLVFKPEFGLELEAPFAYIRWNMAPDINAMMNNRIASSTSVTLSWKFSF